MGKNTSTNWKVILSPDLIGSSELWAQSADHRRRGHFSLAGTLQVIIPSIAGPCDKQSLSQSQKILMEY